MLQDSKLLNQHWIKIVAPIIDTLLLLSGIAMAIQIHQYPYTHAWLSAKLIALILYIILGTIALKRGKTKRIRSIALFVSWLIFSYIVLVALNRTPNPITIFLLIGIN
jgi:uncharacterized membrane protein SirB2